MLIKKFWLDFWLDKIAPKDLFPNLFWIYEDGKGLKVAQVREKSGLLELGILFRNH